MICEHETELELMGARRPAIIRYEPDADDGFPCIEAVEIGRAIQRIGYTEHVSVDILPVLDEADLLRLEQCVCKARLSWYDEYEVRA